MTEANQLFLASLILTLIFLMLRYHKKVTLRKGIGFYLTLALLGEMDEEKDYKT